MCNILGKMLAGIVRGVMTSGSVILVAVLLTGNWNFLDPLFLLLLVLNCAVFVGLEVIVGLSVRSLESVGLYNNFIIIPMIYRLQEFAFIHDMWAEPEYRQNGIARQMVMLTIEHFHQMGVKQIRLDTAAVNETARRLFVSCGFRFSTIEMLIEI